MSPASLRRPRSGSYRHKACQRPPEPVCPILRVMAEFVRRSARVLLLDASDRLLLVQSGHAWFAPGGGVEEGEELADAAARELREEIGLTVASGELHPVAYTTGRADLGWANDCSVMTSSSTGSPATR